MVVAEVHEALLSDGILQSGGAFSAELNSNANQPEEEDKQ